MYDVAIRSYIIIYIIIKEISETFLLNTNLENKCDSSYSCSKALNLWRENKFGLQINTEENTSLIRRKQQQNSSTYIERTI